jgi:hypothetical protein
MTSQGSEYLLTFINKDYIRKAMKEIYKDLDIESWFRTYDLMESINSFLFSKDDSKLQLFLTQYTPLFLTSKNLHSKIVIFKELEENLRDLKHHSGSIMSEYMRMEMGVLPDDFFDLLSSYGEPNLEEWNEEMKELLESS